MQYLLSIDRLIEARFWIK